MPRRPARRLPAWLAVGFGYIVFVMFDGCASQLILFPQRGRLDARGATRKLVPFENGQLEVLVARSPGAAVRPVEAYVLTFVGNAARAEHTAAADARDWAARSVEVWTVNHPGFGGSTGRATLERLPRAALVAHDAILAEARGKPVLLSGFSLGTTMALHAAAHRPAAGLILRSPPPLRSLIMGRFGWWNLWLAATPVALGVPDELDSLKNGSRLQIPALFLLTHADEVVPLEYQQKVVEAYAGEKRIVTNFGGLHNDPLGPTTLEEYRRGADWLWRAAIDKK